MKIDGYLRDLVLISKVSLTMMVRKCALTKNNVPFDSMLVVEVLL